MLICLAAVIFHVVCSEQLAASVRNRNQIVFRNNQGFSVEKRVYSLEQLIICHSCNALQFGEVAYSFVLIKKSKDNQFWIDHGVSSLSILRDS